MSITGKFITVEMPASVQPGKRIVGHLVYDASSTAASFSMCVMAKIGLGGVETIKIVQVDQPWGKDESHDRQLDFGVMPNEKTPIKLRLLAHDTRLYGWKAADWRD